MECLYVAHDGMLVVISSSDFFVSTLISHNGSSHIPASRAQNMALEQAATAVIAQHGRRIGQLKSDPHLAAITWRLWPTHNESHNYICHSSCQHHHCGRCLAIAWHAKCRFATEAADSLVMHKPRDRGTVSALNFVECLLHPSGKDEGPVVRPLFHHSVIPGALPPRPIVILCRGEAVSKRGQAIQHVETPLFALCTTTFFCSCPRLARVKF